MAFSRTTSAWASPFGIEDYPICCSTVWFDALSDVIQVEISPEPFATFSADHPLCAPIQDGQTGDKFSMHAGCPVIKGTKWSATKCASWLSLPISTYHVCAVQHDWVARLCGWCIVVCTGGYTAVNSGVCQFSCCPWFDLLLSDLIMLQLLVNAIRVLGINLHNILIIEHCRCVGLECEACWTVLESHSLRRLQFVVPSMGWSRRMYQKYCIYGEINYCPPQWLHVLKAVFVLLPTNFLCNLPELLKLAIIYSLYSYMVCS